MSSSDTALYIVYYNTMAAAGERAIGSLQLYRTEIIGNIDGLATGEDDKEGGW